MPSNLPHGGLKASVPPKPEGKPIKTLIVTGYMGSLGERPEEEAAYIARLFLELYGMQLDYTHTTAVNEIDASYRLVIIDYGGLMPGAESAAEWQVRAVCEWAEEHPSRLVLIWSLFTAKIWKSEVEDHFHEQSNILLWVPVDDRGWSALKLDEETKYQNKVTDTIKALLG
jgi:hypothetical protein